MNPRHSSAERLADGYLRNPQVSVTVKEFNSRKISVIGQVRKPGRYGYHEGMTLVEAIADRPFKEQLRSPQFVGITLFFSINLTWQLFFFSTVLSEVPWDKEETKVFTAVVTLVACGVPPLLTLVCGQHTNRG